MLPQTINKKALDATASDYDGEKLDEYWALYAGGDAFRKIIDKMIIKREVEEKQTTFGMRSYKERKRRACYINRVGGFIDWATAEVTKHVPRIVVDGGTEEQVAFWEGMNRDCDGEGTPFHALAARLIVDEMVSRRSFAMVRQDDQDLMQAYFGRVNPCSVLDWQESNGGDLAFAKVKYSEPYRPESFLPADGEVVTWCIYVSEGGIVTEYKYRAVCKHNNYVDPVTDESITDIPMVEQNQFDGSIPLHLAQVTRSQWVVDRVYDCVKQLFNTELDLRFAESETSYPQMVLTVDNPNRLESIIKSELNVIVLETGDKVEYLSPSVDSYEPLRKSIESLKMAIHETVQMMAKDAANIPQAGRMSGETVREIRQPIESLLYSYAWPIEDLLMSCIEQIKSLRREDGLSVRIVGLGPEEVEAAEVKGALENGREEDYGDDGGGAEGYGEEEAGQETEG